jgi:hypothetical protein
MLKKHALLFPHKDLRGGSAPPRRRLGQFVKDDLSRVFRYQQKACGKIRCNEEVHGFKPPLHGGGEALIEEDSKCTLESVVRRGNFKSSMLTG